MRRFACAVLLSCWAAAAVAAEAQAQLAFVAAVIDAINARLTSDEEGERKELWKAVAAADSAPGSVPDDALLPVLDRLKELYPGGRPSVSAEVRRQAVQIYLRILDVQRRQHGDVSEQVENTCYGLSWMSGALNDRPEHLKHATCVLESRRKRLGEDHPETARAWQGLTTPLIYLNRLAEAEAHIRRAIAILEKGDGSREAALAHSSALGEYAQVMGGLGRIDEHEAALRRSVAVLERAFGADSEEYLFALGAVVNFYRAWQRHDEADALSVSAYAVLEKRSPEGFLTSIYAQRAAMAAQRGGRLQEARALYEKSLAVQRKMMPGYANIAGIHVALADVAQAEGDRQRARGHLHEALEHWKGGGYADSLEAAGALTRLGVLALADGEPAAARRELDRALDIHAKAQQGRVARIWTLFHRARAAESPAAASGFVARAVIDVRAEFAATDNMQIDVLRARREYRPIVSAYLRNAGARGGADAAATFEAGQLANVSDTAATLVRMAARLSAGRDALGALLREQQDAMRRWRDVDTGLARLPVSGADAERKSLQAQREQLDATLQTLNRRLAQEFPTYRTLTGSEPVPARAAAALLRHREALLAFHFDGDAAFAWVVTRNAEHFVPLQITEAQLRDSVWALRRTVDATGPLLPPFDLRTAHELYVRILQPLEPLLGDAEHLLVVPDGALRSLPLGVLLRSPAKATESPGDYAAHDWLIRKYAFSVLPSVSTLRALRQLPVSAQWMRPFAGFADPVLEGRGGAERGLSAAQLFRGARANVDALRKLDRLPESRDEVMRIGSILAANADDLFFGSDATEARVRATPLARYRVVAFATHALMSGEMDGVSEPALVMTPPREASPEDDGLLTASEIAELKMAADWVILSACNTAAPDGSPGAESLSGLAKAFFHAGARSVLASHWYVLSEPAVTLMTGMFEGYAKRAELGKAQALRASMLALMQNKSHPANGHPAAWAPFMVIGEGGR